MKGKFEELFLEIVNAGGSIAKDRLDIEIKKIINEARKEFLLMKYGVENPDQDFFDGLKMYVEALKEIEEETGRCNEGDLLWFVKWFGLDR